MIFRHREPMPPVRHGAALPVTAEAVAALIASMVAAAERRGREEERKAALRALRARAGWLRVHNRHQRADALQWAAEELEAAQRGLSGPYRPDRESEAV